jgi:hypothetical protein
MAKTKLAPTNYRSSGNFIAVKPKGQPQKRDTGAFYRERNRILEGLGFSSYHAYLDSQIWAETRAKVLERDGGKCQCCQRKATAVHHRVYKLENLSGQSLEGMIAICQGCHKGIEFKRNGTKLLSRRKVENLLRRRQNTCKSNRNRKKNLAKKASNRALNSPKALSNDADRPPDTTGHKS